MKPAAIAKSSVTLHPTFQNHTDGTRVYTTASIDGRGQLNPQSTKGRPLQPRVDIDVTDTAHHRVAHGVIVDGLHTSNQTNLAVVTAGAALDGNAQTDSFSDVAFPEQIAALTTATDYTGIPGPDGLPVRQRAVVVPGRYLGDATAGTGSQRVADTVGLTVYYSTSTDYTPPSIDTVTATKNGSNAQFTLDAHDAHGVRSAIVMASTDGKTWTRVDLTGGQTWTGTLPLSAGATSVEYFVQVVDKAGNVATSTNKGRNYTLPLATITNITKTEGDTGTRTIKLTVTIPASPTRALKLTYATHDATATAPGDYTAATGTITFKKHTTTLTKTIALHIVGDTLIEPDETFTITLTDTTGNTAAYPATITILNDD